MSGAAALPDAGLPPHATLLYVATVPAPIRNFLVPYAEHFRGRGWQVDAAARGAPEVPVLREAFDRVYGLPFSRSILDLRSHVRGTRAIADLLATEPDIVHVHTPIAAFLTRMAVRRLPRARRPAVVYTAHGFHFHGDGRRATNALFRAAERVAGRWTDRLIVINDEDERAARRWRIVSPSRLVRMPGIGLDTDVYAPSAVPPVAVATARGALGIGPDVPLFVVVGELHPNKRQGDAIRALGRMRHRDAHLALLGDGRDRERLERLAERLGLGERVHLAGFVEDVRPLILASTALLLPSRREGLARSVMEALALEVPVIVSEARGNRELVGADRGIVVATADVAALADAMDRLLDQPEWRCEMGRRGRAAMVARYGLRSALRRHEELYAAVLAERRRDVARPAAARRDPGRKELSRAASARTPAGR